MHLLFLPTEIKSFPTTDSTFEYYANPFEYSKTVCLQKYPKARRTLRGCPHAFCSEHKNTKTDLSRSKKAPKYLTPTTGAKEGQSKKRTFPAYLRPPEIMKIGCQICRNQVSLIVGSIAASIFAENERGALSRRIHSRFARTRRR